MADNNSATNQQYYNAGFIPTVVLQRIIIDDTSSEELKTAAAHTLSEIAEQPKVVSESTADH